MFISKTFHKQLATAEAEASAAKQHVASLQTALDWARFRITQLEKERAQLVYAALGAKIPVPEFTQDPTAGLPQNLLTSMPSFDDLGDEEAARQGIGWKDDGSVKYQSERG